MSHGPSHGLSHGQTQIWIGQRLHGRSPLYNMAFAFVFEAALRAELFVEAWRRVADGSDALRTRLTHRDGGGMGRVLHRRAPATTLLDLASLGDPEEEFRRWCRQRCGRPLPLSGELVESVLVRLGEGRTGWYLNQHHLVTDAWSTRLLFRRVAAQYEALLRGKAHGDGPALAPLAAYYPTAAALAAKEEQAGADARAGALEHWRARNEGPGRIVPFYGRRAEPAGTASRRRTLELDGERSRALEALARREGFRSLSEELSRFAVFATLLASWLHGISGRRELGFDAPVTGRPSPEAKTALGLFIEIFPFAATVRAGDTFRSLGARCLEEAMLFLRHARPGMSSPAGASAGNVVLNYFPAAFGAFAGHPTAVEWVHPGHGDDVHALRLQVHDFAGSGRYTLHFDFNEGALPEPLPSRCLGHFEKVLDALLGDPDRPIAAIDLAGGEEPSAAPCLGSPAALRATVPPPLPDRSVVAMFEAQAELTPHRPALRQGDRELSFSDLRREVDALAAALLARGLGAGDRVAILSRRSTLAVVAILATLRARGAYVPIDPSVPPARREHAVRDSGAVILLAGDSGAPEEPVPGVEVLAIADGVRRGRALALRGPGPGLGDLAYLIYTSGSTGRPKGVLIEHRGLADYLSWAARCYVRGDRLSFPLFTSLAFDLTLTSLFLPLITGGTLVIYPEPEGPVDTALMDVVRDNAVDFIKLTPSHLGWLEEMNPEGSRLRRVVVGGENLRCRLAASIQGRLGAPVEIYNEYGPTEAVVGCIAHRYDPAADTGTSVPIGVAADHVQVEVLNEARCPVPEGVPGELWISRHGLARGYHGRPALTAERFQPDPRREAPPGPAGPPARRRYRTGDLVRAIGEGRLEYLGRLDRQLKIAGFRVEPGEIETAFLSLPGVEGCAVLPRRAAAEEAQEVPRAVPRPPERVRHCLRCGLPSNFPQVSFDGRGVCGVCRSYESIKDHAQAYFRTLKDLRAVFEECPGKEASSYDCMMLLSGGKDSTYALCRLVEMGFSVYAFTLDNGYIADGAKENIRRVTEQLGVPLELATTPAMNAIFRDSLMRFSNVCNGCFKTIYTLSLKRARELGIPIIVTGLSRGQMFETRLTGEVFRDGRRSPEEIDAAVLAARKVYHRMDDEVSRRLDVEIFRDDRIFEEVRIVDFYRYCDVALDEMYAYLRRRVPWARPEDTGRSTNCLINDTGIYVHKRERGFHNYALPYSWDVRLGHKTREAALEELDDTIDEAAVGRILAQVGYEGKGGEQDPATAAPPPAPLEAFYVAPEEISEGELRQGLAERLPSPLIPTYLRRVDAIPLTANGKVDERALLGLGSGGPTARPYRAPEGPVEEYLAQAWQEELGVRRLGADDHFFELGGTSLSAIQVMLRLCQEFDIDLPLDGMFSHPTLGGLARVAEDRILADVEGTQEMP